MSSPAAVAIERPVETLVDLLTQSATHFGRRPLLGQKLGEHWTWTSYQELAELVDHCRGGLASLGIRRGDRVALVSDNRLEWMVAAFAAFGLGAAIVPMIQAQAPTEWRFIVEDSKASALICATREIRDACANLLDQLPTLTQLICCDSTASPSPCVEALMKTGRDAPTPPVSLAPGDAATVLYTPGTTGQPKGAILSHGNICSNVEALAATFPLSSADRSLSILPWAHAFGQTCELYTMMRVGGSLALAESSAQIVSNLGEVQPTVLISVPTIFNRIVDQMNRQMVARPRVIRKLFVTGMELSAKGRRQSLGLTERAALATADRLVLSRIRNQLGGKLRYAFSGGAALCDRATELFETLGIPLYEGYGLTEASPVVTTNSPRSRRFGSVGKPLAGVRVTIDTAATSDPKHGELVAYGPGVMQGYLDRPEASAAVFTADGGLRTGDIATLDAEGFVHITGHLDQRYKLNNGRHVFPTPLEERLRQSPYIANLMVHGDGREYNVALVVVDLDTLNQWTSQRELHFDDTASLLASERVKGHILAEIGELSGDFRPYERVRDVALVATGFSAQNGMLTRTHKLKRQAIMAQHGGRLAALYDRSGSATA